MPAIDRLLAPAKLTRSLRVVGRRDDGFHLLDAEMVSLDLADELELGEGDGLEIVDAIAWTEPPPAPMASARAAGLVATEGPSKDASLAPGPATRAARGVPTGCDNLVAKALRMVGRRAHVRLVKRVPPGAGLGGGSSDAAAVLRWAGWADTLAAARLGADVPFCLAGGRARVSGIGEILEPLDVVEETFVVVSPPFGVSTAAAYEAFDEVGPDDRGEGGSNDLERAACMVEPRLARWRLLLAEATGQRPRLAGSGSSWFFSCGTDDGAATALAADAARAIALAHERAALNVCKAVGPGAR